MINRMSLKVNLDVKYGNWSAGSPLINDPKYKLNKLSVSEKQEILSQFSQYLADRMVDLLKKRIKTQYRYLKWSPLTPGYLAFKSRMGLSLNIWEATGYLLNNITYYQEGNNYIVGIDPYVVYPDTKVNVLFVAKCMEFGTRYMPARPLFGPTVMFMRRHVRKYWESFLENSMRW